MDPNDFGKIFRMFLGFPSERNKARGEDQDQIPSNYAEENKRDPWEIFVRRPPDDRNFSVYTDPIEIHRFFEQEMDNMLRNFGFGKVIGGGFSFGLDSRDGFPSFDDPNKIREENEVSPRSFMLKEDAGQIKKDDEVDSNNIDLDSLFGQKYQNNETKEKMEPSIRIGDSSLFGSGSLPNFMTTGSFITEESSSTLNGGYRSSRTVRNSDGSSEVTTTRRIGDQTHQQKICTDKEGNTTTQNQFTNIKEEELDQFESKWKGESNSNIQDRQIHPRNRMISPPNDRLYESLWSKFWGN